MAEKLLDEKMMTFGYSSIEELESNALTSFSISSNFAGIEPFLYEKNRK
jgi:hypothetical protein